MAKKKPTARKGTKKGEISKSEAIRQYLAKNRKATPTEVKAALAEQKIEVTTGLVSQVKSATKRKRARRKTATPTAKKASSPVVRLDDLLKAKALVESLGSVERAQATLSILAKVRS